MKEHIKVVLFLTTLFVSTIACGYQSVLQQNGYSKEPTISDGQKMFTEAVSLSDLKRGDIVYFEFNGVLLTKRIIGLPGEQVYIYDGNIYIR